MRLTGRFLSFLFLLLWGSQGHAQEPVLRQQTLRLHTPDSSLGFFHTAGNAPQLRSLVLLPTGAATAHYGFFCRQELKWDKALPFQLRFRAGAPADCDRLEGKRRD